MIRYDDVDHMTFTDFAYIPINQKYSGLIDPDISFNNIIANVNNFFEFCINDLPELEFETSK